MRPLDAPGEFQTQRKVAVVLETRSGQRVDSICLHVHFCTHTMWRNPEGLKFHILFLNKPLQGGLDAPGDSDELTTAMISKYVAMFKAYSELEGTLSGLSKFTRSILKICKQGQASSVRPSFHQCIENAILRATRIIVRTIGDSSLDQERGVVPVWPKRLRCRYSKLWNVLSCDPFTAPVFAMVRKRVKEEDRELFRAIDWHKCAFVLFLHLFTHTHTLHYSKIKTWIRCSRGVRLLHRRAEAELSQITKRCRTPLEMAQCIANTSKLVKLSVEEHYRKEMERKPKASYKEFATDDLLCNVLYVITRVPQPLFSCF